MWASRLGTVFVGLVLTSCSSPPTESDPGPPEASSWYGALENTESSRMFAGRAFGVSEEEAKSLAWHDAVHGATHSIFVEVESSFEQKGVQDGDDFVETVRADFNVLSPRMALPGTVISRSERKPYRNGFYYWVHVKVPSHYWVIDEDWFLRRFREREHLGAGCRFWILGFSSSLGARSSIVPFVTTIGNMRTGRSPTTGVATFG